MIVAPKSQTRSETWPSGCPRLGVDCSNKVSLQGKRFTTARLLDTGGRKSENQSLKWLEPHSNEREGYIALLRSGVRSSRTLRQTNEFHCKGAYIFGVRLMRMVENKPGTSNDRRPACEWQTR